MPDEHSPVSQPNDRVWFYSGLLLTIYLVITPWGIQNQSVSNPDEPLYAASARAMIRGGDKLLPTFNTQPRLVKPIMIYWVLVAGAAAGMALGMSMLTALHIGPIFMGLLAALGTFLIGRRIRDARFGFMAAIVQVTAHRFHEIARELLTDMTLTAFLVWAWFCFLIAVDRLIPRMESKQAGESGGGRALFPLLGFYACLGFACMTKGPVLVAVFAVVPMLAYLFWLRRGAILKHAGVWWGVPLSLAIGLWWFVYLARHGYSDDVYRFFTTQNFDRFVEVEGADGHPWPYLFYIWSLGDAFLPWVILLPVALGCSFRAWRALPKGALTNDARFVICALLLPFAAFGLSINKRSVYLVPLYPYLSLYLVWALDAAFFRPEADEAPVTHKPERYRVAYAILAGAVLLTLGLELFIRPARERFYARPEFYRHMDELSAGRPVVICGLDIHEAVWYFDRPNEEILECPQAQLSSSVFPPDHVLIVREDFLNKHPNIAQKFAIFGTAHTREITFAIATVK